MGLSLMQHVQDLKLSEDPQRRNWPGCERTKFTNCKFHLSLHPKLALAYQVLVVAMLLCKSMQLVNDHKTADQLL